MRKIKILLVAALVLCMAVCMVACGKDDGSVKVPYTIRIEKEVPIYKDGMKHTVVVAKSLDQLKEYCMIERIDAGTVTTAPDESVSTYNEEFFQDNVVLLLTFIASDGAESYTVSSVKAKNGLLTIEVKFRKQKRPAIQAVRTLWKFVEIKKNIVADTEIQLSII